MIITEPSTAVAEFPRIDIPVLDLLVTNEGCFMFFGKLGLALLAVIASGVIWPSLVWLLNSSGIGSLRSVAFLSSSQSILGLGFFGLLAILIYELLINWILRGRG